ncbi:MAG: hypothetical protein RJA07_120 [Bacteroidota bacterium]|jgi:uncharacterized protein (TIGR02231 family)
MTKKIFILISLISLSAKFSFADKEITTKASIKSVVIYLQGAEVTNVFKAQIPSGQSTIIVQGLPANLNQSTLQVGAEKGVIIQSTEYRMNYLNQNQKSDRLKALTDTLEMLNIIHQKLENQKNVLDDQIATLAANKVVGGANTGMSVAELQKLMDYTFAKTIQLKTDIMDVDTKEAKNQEKINRISNQMNEENAKINQPSGEVVLQLVSNNSTNADFNLTYMTPNAGWTPIYDLRCENIQSKIKLFYKAQVYQNTGMAWNDVKITISTGNPNESGTSPVMQPWYLQFGQVYTQQRAKYKSAAPAQAPVAYSLNNTLSTSSGAATYQWDAGADVAQGSLAQYTTVTESQLNATFDIDLKYDIPADGKVHLVSMVDYELPATYQYYAAPKLDKDAFLLARITDWEKLNLLPANTNIFFEGTYVGQSYVDTRNTRDTLSFSLGRDKKVIIKRQKIKDYSSTKLIGTNRKEEFTYDITLRNTKKDAIQLIILDQYPLTTDKDIEIELLEQSNASVDAEKAQLTWRFEMKPQENKTLRLHYSVKYPKDKVINNLN